jgi:hypothetical protein
MSLPLVGGKRLTPEIGFGLANGSRGSVSAEYMDSARAGVSRQSAFSAEGGGRPWARDAAKRYRSNGLGDNFGSTSRFANGTTTFQVVSYQGTTDTAASLEYLPVWGQRLDISFVENDPFRRNTNNASAASGSFTMDDKNCPMMRVLTQANVNLLLSYETAENNLVNGRRRTPMETLVHLGITFLGFVQVVHEYASGLRMFTIFCAGYGVAGLSTTLRVHNAGLSIWLGVTRLTADGATKKGMGDEFVIGSEKRIVPAPNVTAGSATVRDPVQVHFVVDADAPYDADGLGSYWFLGRIEKVNVPGASNAAECSRKDGVGTLAGRYQIVLKSQMNRV